MTDMIFRADEKIFLSQVQVMHEYCLQAMQNPFCPIVFRFPLHQIVWCYKPVHHFKKK
jgi:hypothetical protein